MNTKRIFFWLVFVIILGLIIWGLVVALNRSSASGLPSGTPPPVTSADHIEGPANAPVTLIEYGDFQCPACGEYAPVVEQLFSELGTSTLRVVFRHFPLPQHQNAIIGAEAAEAASDQGQFWGMYKLLYAGQTTWQYQSDSDAQATFDSYAAQLGLNIPQFNTDMMSSSSLAVIDADQAEGQSLGLDYTPTFFINGKIIENPQGYEPFKEIIEAAAH